jgi:hypothetical protein
MPSPRAWRASTPPFRRARPPCADSPSSNRGTKDAATCTTFAPRAPTPSPSTSSALPVTTIDDLDRALDRLRAFFVA